MVDMNQFKNLHGAQTRYERRIRSLQNVGIDIKHIEHTVLESINNIDSKSKSFVIYGEPQSGKTEMMIALTAKLLDTGHKIIVILLTDNKHLLSQNLKRFRESGVDPTPCEFREILEENIGDKNWIIFAKKNSNDLKKLIEKLYAHKENIIIIDDEADYASPNSKINIDERTAINNSIYNLLGNNGTYIGVTATPARLDLNNTFNNITEKWVDFEPHDEYVGKDTFFPLDLQFNYSLRPLPDEGDDPKYLRDALLSFLVRVGYINTQSHIKRKLTSNTDEDICFSFLIHTSGKTADHKEDENIVNKIFDVLSDDSNP